MASVRARASYVPDAPAERTIDNYFVVGATSFRSRPRTTLLTTLGADLRRIGRQLRCLADVEALWALGRGQRAAISCVPISSNVGYQLFPILHIKVHVHQMSCFYHDFTNVPIFGRIAAVLLSVFDRN